MNFVLFRAVSLWPAECTRCPASTMQTRPLNTIPIWVRLFVSLNHHTIGLIFTPSDPVTGRFPQMWQFITWLWPILHCICIRLLMLYSTVISGRQRGCRRARRAPRPPREVYRSPRPGAHSISSGRSTRTAASPRRRVRASKRQGKGALALLLFSFRSLTPSAEH